jgi:hypothetical protein
MPQLDIMIWLNLCTSSTLLFWLIYILVVRIILSKINIIFNIRNSLKDYIFLIYKLKIYNLYIFNYNYFVKIYYFIILQNKMLIDFFINLNIFKEKITYLLHIILVNKINNFFNINKIYYFNLFLNSIFLNHINKNKIKVNN